MNYGTGCPTNSMWYNRKNNEKIFFKEASWYVVKTTLSTITAKIGVSKYKILEEIPKYLADKLNDIDEI